MNKRDLMDTDIENTTGPTEDSMETEDSVRYFKLPSSYKQRKGKNVKFTISNSDSSEIIDRFVHKQDYTTYNPEDLVVKKSRHTLNKKFNHSNYVKVIKGPYKGTEGYIKQIIPPKYMFKNNKTGNIIFTQNPSQRPGTTLLKSSHSKALVALEARGGEHYIRTQYLFYKDLVLKTKEIASILSVLTKFSIKVAVIDNMNQLSVKNINITDIKEYNEGASITPINIETDEYSDIEYIAREDKYTDSEADSDSDLETDENAQMVSYSDTQRTQGDIEVQDGDSSGYIRDVKKIKTKLKAVKSKQNADRIYNIAKQVATTFGISTSDSIEILLHVMFDTKLNNIVSKRNKERLGDIIKEFGIKVSEMDTSDASNTEYNRLVNELNPVPVGRRDSKSRFILSGAKYFGEKGKNSLRKGASMKITKSPLFIPKKIKQGFSLKEKRETSEFVYPLTPIDELPLSELPVVWSRNETKIMNEILPTLTQRQKNIIYIQRYRFPFFIRDRVSKTEGPSSDWVLELYEEFKKRASIKKIREIPKDSPANVLIQRLTELINKESDLRLSDAYSHAISSLLEHGVIIPDKQGMQIPPDDNVSILKVNKQNADIHNMFNTKQVGGHSQKPSLQLEGDAIRVKDWIFYTEPSDSMYYSDELKSVMEKLESYDYESKLVKSFRTQKLTEDADIKGRTTEALDDFFDAVKLKKTSKLKYIRKKDNI